MTCYALLPDRAILSVYGQDARAFLQGLITNDVNKVTQEQAIFAALLSPQGRFLFDFFIIEHEGKLLFDTDKARLPDLKKRLLMYRLRSKVEIEECPGFKVSAAWGREPRAAGGGIGYDDPRLPELGIRILSTSFSPAMTHESAGDYHTHRMSLGVPEGACDLIPDRSILLEYGYDELHGIDFAKGCYVGQEVTARSKHRASLRKFIHRVRGPAPLPPPGAVVLAGEREAGVMAGSAGPLGLALLRVEEVRKNEPLSASGVPLEANLPSWCKTSFAS